MEPDHGLACFAMYVMNKLGVTKPEEATTMLHRKKLEKMPIEQVLGWLGRRERKG